MTRLKILRANRGRYSGVGGGGNNWLAEFGVTDANSDLILASGRTVTLDSNVVCKSLTIVGTLNAAINANTSLTAANINIMGTGVFTVGTEASPLPAAFTHTLTLTGAEVGRTARTVNATAVGFTNDGIGRSLQVQPGGKLSMIGTAPTIKRTKLNAHAANGASTFTLADTTGWKAGDEIAIGTTDFYGVASAQKLTLQSNASGTSVTTTGTVTGARWGVMQYVTDAGMSLSPDTLTAPPATTPTTVDQRAFVVNLTRNIVVQGANDSAWSTSKFGAHLMFMGRTSEVRLDGVRFSRAGQAGALGRYPIHWHMASYNMPGGMTANSDGTFLGAVVAGNYAKNCAFDQSSQRMMTIHGTHGVTLDGNVGFDITGHAIFLEDGSEQDNFITNNVVMKIRSPTTANRLVLHDSPATADALGVNLAQGTTGVWNSNPKNTITGNWVNDTQGVGFWNAFGLQCFGLSTAVALVPKDITLLTWDDNTAMGCFGAGAMTARPPNDSQGNNNDVKYDASFNVSPLKRLQSFKNQGGGYNNRIFEGQYEKFVCADNAGMDVFGQTTSEFSNNFNTLVVAESLNNATSRRVSSYRAAFASYHEFLNFKNCMAVGYKYIAGSQPGSSDVFTGGGLIRLNDLYTDSIFTFESNTIKLIDCTAPFRTLAPFKDGQATSGRHFQMSGAIYDANGIFGAASAGKYWVINDPFLTVGAAGLTDITPGTPANGAVTTTKYFSMTQPRYNDELFDNYTYPFFVSRQDTNGTEVGNWNVADGHTGNGALPNMRAFSAQQGGRYLVTVPGYSQPTYYSIASTYQKVSTDRFLVGLPFTGAQSPRVFQYAELANLSGSKINMAVNAQASIVSLGVGRYLTAAANFAAVVADTTGTIFWQDTANNTVWMQITNVTSMANTRYGAGTAGVNHNKTYWPINTVIGT